MRKLYILGLVVVFLPSVLIWGMLFNGDNISDGIFLTEIVIGLFVVKMVVKYLSMHKKTRHLDQ